MSWRFSTMPSHNERLDRKQMAMLRLDNNHTKSSKFLTLPLFVASTIQEFDFIFCAQFDERENVKRQNDVHSKIKGNRNKSQQNFSYNMPNRVTCIIVRHMYTYLWHFIDTKLLCMSRAR